MQTKPQNPMLSEDKVIAIYCIVDDMLKAIHHPEDIRRRINDSEIITTAVVSTMYFSGHQENAIGFMKTAHMIPHSLSVSRYNRRLHKVGGLLSELFLQISSLIQNISCEMEYVLDSFPVAVCDNIRIHSSKLLKGKKWRGYTASMRRYFYGVKVQLLITKNGIPVSFCFVPGKQADVKSLEKMVANLPSESSVYADSAYTNYSVEDTLKIHSFISLKIQRKSNSKRPDSAVIATQKTKMRKRVEAIISNIKKKFPKNIHAVTLNGFLIKLILFIFAVQFTYLIN